MVNIKKKIKECWRQDSSTSPNLLPGFSILCSQCKIPLNNLDGSDVGHVCFYSCSFVLSVFPSNCCRRLMLFSRASWLMGNSCQSGHLGDKRSQWTFLESVLLPFWYGWWERVVTRRREKYSSISTSTFFEKISSLYQSFCKLSYMGKSSKVLLARNPYLY